MVVILREMLIVLVKDCSFYIALVQRSPPFISSCPPPPPPPHPPFAIIHDNRNVSVHPFIIFKHQQSIHLCCPLWIFWFDLAFNRVYVISVLKKDPQHFIKFACDGKIKVQSKVSVIASKRKIIGVTLKRKKDSKFEVW